MGPTPAGEDRLDGFGGSGTSYVFQDLKDYPRSKLRIAADPGRKHRKTPACNAAISVRDMEAPRADALRLTAAALKYAAVGCFMSAASPGVVGLFFRNDYYRDHETCIVALAAAMRHEYEAMRRTLGTRTNGRCSSVSSCPMASC